MQQKQRIVLMQSVGTENFEQWGYQRDSLYSSRISMQQICFFIKLVIKQAVLLFSVQEFTVYKIFIQTLHNMSYQVTKVIFCTVCSCFRSVCFHLCNRVFSWLTELRPYWIGVANRVTESEGCVTDIRGLKIRRQSTK